MTPIRRTPGATSARRATVAEGAQSWVLDDVRLCEERTFDHTRSDHVGGAGIDEFLEVDPQDCFGRGPRMRSTGRRSVEAIRTPGDAPDVLWATPGGVNWQPWRRRQWPGPVRDPGRVPWDRGCG